MGKVLFKSFPVGSPLGIPVRIQGLFVVFFALLGSYFLVVEGVTKGLDTILFLGAAFFFVVFHELGHAIVAQKLGVRVIDVTIWPLGGMARLENVPRAGLIEIAIAVAGPLVNFTFAFLLFGLQKILTLAGAGHIQTLEMLAWINILLALFNILPAFPLDGGRILRGGLSFALGFDRATTISVLIGRLLAILLSGVSMYFHMPFLILVAVFIFYAARQEDQEMDATPMKDDLSRNPA